MKSWKTLHAKKCAVHSLAMSVRRPETLGVSPDAFYDSKEATKYHKSSRIVRIQRELTERAIELLNLPAERSCYILDIGCGSGLSGQALEKAGHHWVGCDISPSMLAVATGLRIGGGEEGGDSVGEDSEEEGESEDVEDEEEDDDSNEGLTMSDLSKGMISKKEVPGGWKRGREEDEDEEEEEDNEDNDADDDDDDDDDDVNDDDYTHEEKGGNAPPPEPLPSLEDVGDVLKSDMGQGLPFRPASFDGVISISAIQWLCYSSSSDQDPKLRLNRFFSALYSVLKRDAKAILQFYPENAEQAYLIAQAASKVGFAGGVLVDYPNSTKAKKYYLCLSFERSYRMPKALGTGDTAAGAMNEKMNNSVFVRSSTNENNKGGYHQSKSQKKIFKRGDTKMDWIARKKEKRRRQGKDVKGDSKFTGRKRSRAF